MALPPLPDKLEKRKVILELTEFDIEILLTSLGRSQNVASDQGHDSKPIRFLIDKIYRAMGVRLYS